MAQVPFVVQVEMFRMEKAKLDMEVAKWDDSGNDIIVMAKQMCMIMMEMTDFTRSVDHSVLFLWVGGWCAIKYNTIQYKATLLSVGYSLSDI